MTGRVAIPSTKACPGRSGRVWRNSINNVVPPKITEPQKSKQSRRVTFVDFPNTSRPSSATTEADEDAHKNEPIATVSDLPSSASVTSDPSSTKNDHPRKPKSKSKHNTPQEMDEETMELKRQIAELERKLQQRQDDEATEIDAIASDTEKRKVSFRESQRLKYGLPDEKTAARLILQGMESTRTLESNQHTIQELRKANKTLRQGRESLATKIVSFKQENAELEFEKTTTEEYYETLSTFRKGEEKVYSRFLTTLPRYRLKVDKLQMKSEKQDDLIQAERAATEKCRDCIDAMVSMVQSQCQNNPELIKSVLAASRS